jgi:hypothetical protein
MDGHFRNLMGHLFQHMEIEMPRHQDDNGYAVPVDGKAKMKFFVAPAGYLNIISIVAEAPGSGSPATLLDLLKMNSFTPLLPEFNFKLGVEPTSNNVELWMREPLQGLEADRLIEGFHLFLEVAGYVKNYLDRTLAGTPSQHVAAGIAPQEALA